MITWAGSKTEYQLASKIARRAVEDYGDSFDYSQTEMDIMAVHLNSCPLDLVKLLAASPLDFAHDLSGIRNCIDRDTGELKKNFWPRHAERR